MVACKSGNVPVISIYDITLKDIHAALKIQQTKLQIKSKASSQEE